MEFFNSIIEKVKPYYDKAVEWFKSTIYAPLNNFYEQFVPENIRSVVEFKWAFIGLIAIVLLLLIIICSSIKKHKSRKIKFIVDGEVYKVLKKVKYKKVINYPDSPVKEGFEFVGWYKDRKLTKPYTRETYNKKKSIKLYAKFTKLDSEQVAEAVKNETPTATLEQPSVLNQNVAEQTKEETVEQSSFVTEEVLEVPTDLTVKGLGYFYDEIRYEMLCYERANAFKKLGVVKKQIVAEMFERDDAVYLYLAVDPNNMIKKGYKVEKYDSPEFAIVPCKKTVKTEEDFNEAKALLKEAMLVNNLVHSDIITVSKTESDEQTRKNGFVFYLKNEQVATTASDYYKYLRAVVLSYSASSDCKIPDSLNNKMILKIFKKGEQVMLYLALDSNEYGLEFVGYDKNFVETPSMLKVNTVEDICRANSLIDGLMRGFGMERHPDLVEVSNDEVVDENCGFGYRVRR